MDRSRAAWRKAAKSNGSGSCVEVAQVDDQFWVRDSKDPEGPILFFTPNEWDAFLDGARKGEFNF